MADISRNAQERAYQYLKEQITSLRLRPGDRLRAIAIADALSMSRTPVKEALGRLEQEGLVARSSGWGYVVKNVDLKEARDTYKVREALEVEAAREAIERIDKATLDRLRAILKTAETQWNRANVKEFRKCNREFHNLIAAASGNNVLLDQLAAIDGRVQRLGAMLFEHRLERGPESLSHNRAILEALARNDLNGVEQAVRSHVSDARECMTNYLMDGGIRD